MHSHPKEEEAIGGDRCVIMFVKVNPRVLRGPADG
jgi:hypothetical protein